MDVSNKAVRKALKGARTHKEGLDNLHRLAQSYAKEILQKNEAVKLIMLLGSIGRELSGESLAGTAVWEGSDIDIAWWDSSTDFEKMKTNWKKNTPHWLSGSIALYDPCNLLPELKAECAKWTIENRRKLTIHLWMENLAIKRCALTFLEQGNIPAALWSARKAFELVLDITLLLDNYVPCTPKYDWHCLRNEIRETLVTLHTVDWTDKKAARKAIIEADSRHWELKEPLEEFLGIESVFDPFWASTKFPILRWL